VANSPDFVVHALELLSGVGPVAARAMFGGHGVYARGVMFGLLDDDELFLKTDDASRPRFVAAGCRSWVYVTPTQKMENTSYYRPPDEAHEDPEAMLGWATLALDSALRLRDAKAARGSGAKRKAKPPAPTATGAAKRKRKVRARTATGAAKRPEPAPAKRGAKRSRGRARPR
jgi:DNA transformation protein